jgi:3-phytase
MTGKETGKILTFCVLSGFLFFGSCNPGQSDSDAPGNALMLELIPDAETNPMPDDGDAADDPAIWLNPGNPSESVIIGTNKKKGLETYDLDGTLMERYEVGKINNVDLRSGFPLAGDTIDLIAGSNRTDNSIMIMRVDPVTRRLESIPGGSVKTTLAEVYGICLYHDCKSGRFFVFINSKEGTIEQWQIEGLQNGEIGGTLVRTLAVGSQPEGMVADDFNEVLYVGEEDRGIWKFMAEAGSPVSGTLVDSVGNGYLVDDVEGLAIYATSDSTGYLVASSQGNNSFAVYRREGKNEYLGSFQIEDRDSIDGVSETDGIEACSAFLGPAFPAGVFIAQDGFNKTDSLSDNQNFKIVSWNRIKANLSLK